jgi:hypothetical protein
MSEGPNRDMPASIYEQNIRRKSTETMFAQPTAHKSPKEAIAA